VGGGVGGGVRWVGMCTVHAHVHAHVHMRMHMHMYMCARPAESHLCSRAYYLASDCHYLLLATCY
jgi:hypothetical protein